MFFFLAGFAICGIRPIQLSDKMFESKVLDRKKNEVWAVLFLNESQWESRKLFQKFFNASQINNGTLKFATIDVKKYPGIFDDQKVRSTPKIYIYHNLGSTDYIGKHSPREMLKNMMKFLPDISINVTKSFSRYPAVILFHRYESTPPMWRDLALFFEKRRVFIGASNDDEVMDEFEIDDVPSILFVNGTYRGLYTGPMRYFSIRKEIIRFEQGKYDPPLPKERELAFYSGDFKTESAKSRTLCIIHNSIDLDRAYEDLIRKYQNRHYKWFYGEAGWGNSFIKPGTIWIYDPMEDRYLKIDSFDHLDATLKNIKASDLQWVESSEL